MAFVKNLRTFASKKNNIKFIMTNLEYAEVYLFMQKHDLLLCGWRVLILRCFYDISHMTLILLRAHWSNLTKINRNTKKHSTCKLRIKLLKVSSKRNCATATAYQANV